MKNLTLNPNFTLQHCIRCKDKDNILIVINGLVQGTTYFATYIENHICYDYADKDFKSLIEQITTIEEIPLEDLYFDDGKPLFNPTTIVVKIGKVFTVDEQEYYIVYHGDYMRIYCNKNGQFVPIHQDYINTSYLVSLNKHKYHIIISKG